MSRPGAGSSTRRTAHATTASLEALKLYADSMREKDDGASNTLLRQALTVDPDFAMAHAEMGRRYYLKPDRETRLEAEKHVAKALALVDRLTPRERLWIQAAADDARGLRTRSTRPTPPRTSISLRATEVSASTSRRSRPTGRRSS
jgi:hypothetical protein